MGLLSGDDKEALDLCLQRRHDCAHPSGKLYKYEEVLECIEGVRGLLDRTPQINPNIIVEAVKIEGFTLSHDQAHYIARMVPRERSHQLAHRLLSTFLSAENPWVQRNISRIWMCLREQLPLEARRQMMERLAKELAPFLGCRIVTRGDSYEIVPLEGQVILTELRCDVNDVADLVFWEAIEPGSWYQHLLYEYMLSEYERSAKERAGRGIDKGVLAVLLEFTPEAYKERCVQLNNM